MQLHHHIKPHHHVTIWIVTILQVFLTLGIYNDATLLYAKEQSADGPNEESQAFFGAKVKKRTGSLPSECQTTVGREIPPSYDPSADQPRNNFSDRPKVWDTFESAKAVTSDSSAQILESYHPQKFDPNASTDPSIKPSDYQPNYSPLNPPSSSVSPANLNPEEFNRLSDDDKRRYREKSADNSSAPAADSVYSPGNRPSYDSSNQPPDFMISSDCQKAMIAQIRSEMSEFRDKMKNGAFTAKLDNILAVIDKLENGVDGQKSGLALLKEQGFDTSAIEALFTPIRDDAETLKEFFVEMLTAMDAFFAIDDPAEAFTYMRTQFPQSKPASMGAITNRLAANIKDLMSQLKAISEQLETTPGGSDVN